MMRILFVSCVNAPWGGSEELWGQAALLALKTKNHVVVSMFRTRETSSKTNILKQAGAIVHLRRGLINPRLTKKRRLMALISYRILDAFFDPFKKSFRIKPDIVVFTGACYSIAHHKSVFYLAKESNIPLVLNNQVNAEYGRPINWEQMKFLQEVYRYCSLATFVSQRNLQTTERHLAIKLENSMVIRNPVNLDTIEALPMPNGEVSHFAIVANILVNHKGHDVLLEAFSKPQWRHRSFKLHIYGNGVDIDYVRELVAFFDLHEKIVFEGVTNDILNVWRKNHILVMPSLNEGMPLAMVEAMLCGRPVITTDVGGHTEWIEDGTHGFIAGGASTNALSQALEKAWINRDKWAQLGSNAHFRALELHDQRPDQTFLDLIMQQNTSPTS